jgi:hypothetical protein
MGLPAPYDCSPRPGDSLLTLTPRGAAASAPACLASRSERLARSRRHTPARSDTVPKRHSFPAHLRGRLQARKWRDTTLQRRASWRPGRAAAARERWASNEPPGSHRPPICHFSHKAKQHPTRRRKGPPRARGAPHERPTPRNTRKTGKAPGTPSYSQRVVCHISSAGRKGTSAQRRGEWDAEDRII